MLKIRYVLIALVMLLYSAISSAQVSVSIGINVPVYPQLAVVPGYPVYYAPRLQANFFFYDGLYWVYQDDDWYASSWYNGPWWLVYPEDVPVFILRVPVRYYLQPPRYFLGWRHDAPPRWGDYWGHDWSQHRSGWDRWDRNSVPAPAPKPVYQQQYSGDRYPRLEQQQELHQKKYRYQSRDPIVRQHYQQQPTPRAPAQKNSHDSMSSQQSGSRSESPQRGGDDAQKSIPATSQQRHNQVKDHRQQVKPESVQREQQIQKTPAQQEGTKARKSQGSGQQGIQNTIPRQQDGSAVQWKQKSQEQNVKQQGKETTSEPKRVQEHRGDWGR